MIFQEINTTETEIELNNLEQGAYYRISVISRGIHGTSLPSAMLLINTSHTDFKKTYAAPSPPHLLTVSSHSATWVSISWQPPEFSHPHEMISYKCVYKDFLFNFFIKKKKIFIAFKDIS